MKKLLLLIALLLPALFVTAQGIKNGLKEEPKINVGIKGGCLLYTSDAADEL